MTKNLHPAVASRLTATRWARQGTYVVALLAGFGAQAQNGPASELRFGMAAPGTVRSAVKIATAPVAQTTSVPQSLVATPWASVAPLSEARSQHAAVAQGNNIYVWGGYTGDGSNAVPRNTLEIYDALANTWRSGAAAPTVVRGQAAALGADGFVYSFGGAPSNSSCFRYNPATNAWTLLAPLPNPVWEARAATGNNGRIYVLGGEGSNGPNQVNTLNQVYNPATNTWTTGAPMPTGRLGEVVVKDANGLIHAIGGMPDGSGPLLTTHEVYNPTTNTWSTAAALPTGLNQAGGTLGSDGNLYVVGGKGDYLNNTGPFYSTVYIYSPITNTWTTGTNLPKVLGETAAVTIGQSVYTVAGTDGAQQNVVYRTTISSACNPNANTPVAGTDNFTASCGPLTVTAAQLLANDTSPNGTPLAIGSVGGGGNGTVVDNGNGSYTFTPFPGYTGPAVFTYLLQSAGPIFPSPATGHYYEFVSAPGICWDAARTAAATRTYAGMQGYLATLNTADDVNAIKGRAGFGGQYWFGASDAYFGEGNWRWASGPEAGTLFYIGNIPQLGGITVPGQYSNWSPGEPDNYRNDYDRRRWRPQNENYGMVYGQSGQWNDLELCGTDSQVLGYLVEYGGLEACTPVLYATGTVNINVTNTGSGTPSIVANPNTFATAPGTPVTVTAAQLLANDTDTQNRPLSVSSVSGGTNGTVVDNGNNTYTFTPNIGYTGPATFTYQAQLAGSVFPSATTGHYYEFVAAPNLTWTQARAAAAARTYNGLQGYLATITSAPENSLLTGRDPNNVWFGASDETVEGEWRWATGPEAGTLFYQGNGATGGTTASGQYSNWSSGEPNDFKNQFRPDGEDYAHMYGNSGQWNDLSDNAGGGATSGYFVEYGGLESCTPVLFATGTVTVNVGGVSARSTASGSAKTVPAVLEASPNPSNGQFNVRVVAATNGPAQLDLFDLKGRRISSLFSGELQAGEQRVVPVNVSEVASGLYMVRLQSGKDVKVVRVAIQK